ncbi:hypothetical protein IJ135_00145, partial [Candidatus Saccharibacteria bacterium]|nr:hypothetical protein [Candidatus Saccharibacteria bacterium]
MRNKLVKIFRAMMIGWPAVLYFSYFPLIHLGDNDTMNFELSLPLIYLVVFNIIIAILLFNLKKNHIDFKKYWALALPLYFTLSILWSENVVRGVLTAGVMWAVVAAIAGVWRLRGVIDPRTRRRSVESIIWSGIA